jgi:hypothetical protein
MAIYKVEAPDGQIIKFEGPEDATQEQILAFAAESYVPKKPSDESSLRQVADIPLQIGKGAVTGVRFIADAFGADNPISKTLSGVEDYIGDLLSAQSKQDSEKMGQIMEEAQDKGVGEQLMAALKALSVAPVDLVANALGTAAPALLGGLAGLGLRGAAVISGGMGAGVTKSSIYNAVRDELTPLVGKEEAEARAQLAQQYNGENLDQILLGTGLGALSGFTGIEKSLIPSVVKGIGQRIASKSALTRAGGVALGEAVPEALQGGQEQAAQNIALQREGFDVPTMRGVVGAGALEGLVGGVLGGGIGAIAPEQTQPAKPIQPPAPDLTQTTPPPADIAPPAFAPAPAPNAAQVLDQQRIQKQQAAANQFSNEDNRFNVGSPTGFVSPPLMGPPSTRESLEQQRIQKQEAVPNNFDLKIPVPELATMAPVTPAQTQPRPPATPNTAQKALRIDQLTRQLDTATTDFDRNLIQQQITEAAGGTREPSPAQFVDLTPMNIQTATARIDMLQGQLAQEGGNALGLSVVPHPSTPNAFAIENRPVGLDLNLPRAEVSQQEANARLEQASAEAQPLRDAEQNARRDMLSGIMQTIEERGGVASPMEAQLLEDNGAGRPYDRVDEGLSPPQSVDERLTGATGIDLIRSPRETVADPVVQEEGRFQQMLAQTNEAPTAPGIGATLDALSTPPVARSADQVSTARLAGQRFGPSDLALLNQVASTTGPLDQESQARLNNLINYGPRFDLRDEVSPEAQAVADDVRKKLVPALKKFGLGNVGLKLVDTLNDGKANGQYWKSVITLALDSQDPLGVMRHEVIHALKELGAFTAAEWSVLTKRARSEWIGKYLGDNMVAQYRQQYLQDNNNDITGFQEYIEEEAIAEAFKDFKQTKPPSGMIQNLMRRLGEMFKAIKEFFGARDLNAENIFLAESIFGSVESGRLSQGRGAQLGSAMPAYSLRKNLPPTVAQAAEEVGLTDEELMATSLPLQTGQRGDEGFKTPKVKGLTGAIEFLETRRLESGLPALNVMDDADHDMIAKLITAEAMAAIRTGGNALDWYDGVIKQTLGMASLKHPELATDKNAGTAFRVAMAITSQNLNVEDNIKLADRVYTIYRKTGKFPEIGSGKSLAVMKSSFKRANQTIEEVGFDAFRTFLETPYSVRDLQAVTGTKLSGELMDTMVLGSSIFGPKIGFGFYSNLNGNFDPVTMDMWFMRTIGRLTGKLRAFDEKKLTNQVNRLVNSLKQRGKNGTYATQFDADLVANAKTNREAAFELAKLVKRAHEKDYKNNASDYRDGSKIKTELVLASETIIQSLSKPIDTPASGGERQKLRAIFSKVRDNVKELYGQDVPSASLQAVIWYPEQTLYQTLGVKLRVTNQNYAGAMRKILLGEGYESDRISTAAERGSRGIQPAGGEPVTAGVQRRDKAVSAVDQKQAKRGDKRFSLRPDESSVRPSGIGDGTADGRGGDGRGRDQSRSNTPLEGAPNVQGASGPDQNLVRVAEQYARDNGIPFGRQAEYVAIKPSFAKMVYQAYEDMQDAPQDPAVKEAYADMTRQVLDQYDALVKDGYNFTFFDFNTDPYNGNPFNAMRDLRNNKRMAVYGTYAGYGDAGITAQDLQKNPMLEDTGMRWPDQRGDLQVVTANDVFRAVHDAFGHGLEGAGFRARGEENAFQAHAKLFTGPGLGALASETRGQNSWLNYGPYGEQNQNNKVEDTNFAPQKIGLMPSWTWTENVVGFESDKPRFSLRPDQVAFRPSDNGRAGVSFQTIQPDAKSYVGSHYGKTRVNTLAGNKYGSGLKGAEVRRLAESTDPRIRNRVYFYIPRFNDTMPPKEAGVGNFVFSQKLNNILAPGPTMGRLYSEANGDANAFESAIIDAGYDGYVSLNYGMMVVLNQDVPVDYAGTAAEVSDTKPKFSLKPEQKRVTSTPPFKQWFGNSKVVNEDGSPKVMYHGTARDITEFAPKQANAIFVTASPRFAESFGNTSEDYMVKELFYQMPQVEKRNAIIKAAEALLKQNETTKSVVKNLQATEFEVPDKLVDAGWVLTDIGRSYDPVFSENLEIALRKILLEKLPSRENILPLYVRAEAPFDFENPEHILAIEPLAKYEKEYDKQDDLFYVKQGSWNVIEGEIIQAAIKEAGFDSFYVLEGGTKNLAVYNPNQLKSATGNIGTFSESNDIRYNLVATAPNQPPKVLTKTTPTSRSGKVIVDETLNTLKDITSNESMTNARIQWVDRFSGLTQQLKDLPLYDADGTLRADMVKHSQAQTINLVKTGIVSGTPFINKDGTISIQRSENNLARAEYLADALSTNKNVVESGMTGKNYVAEIARALVGEDILNEDKRLNALGVQQLEQAKDLYKQAKAFGKEGNLKASRQILRQIAKLRREGYKNKNLKRERQVDQAQIDWAKKQLQLVPEAQAIFDIWRNVSDSLVMLYKDTGLLSEENAQVYLDRSFYVPLFKAREDLTDEKFYGLAGVGAKSSTKMKQLKGSDAIRNIWENFDKQYASMVANAYENQSRSIAVKQLVGLGGATITNPTDPRVNLRYKENGELVHVAVDEPTTLAAFQTFNYQLGPIMKFMGALTNVLRAGALINPMFWIRELVRNPIHATLTAGTGVVTPLHSATNFIKIIANASPEARILAERGVIGQIDNTVSLQDFLKDVGRDKLKNPNFVQKALHKLLRVHEASDAATRVAVFKKAKALGLKRGLSEESAVDFAVHKARESLNFSVSGMNPVLNNLRQMIAFLNSTVVGLDSLYKAATGYGLNPVEKAEAKRQFKIKAGVMFTMSVAYALAYQNDDDYKKLPDYVKDNNFLFPLGTGEDKIFVKLSTPYEVGFLLKALPEIAIRYLAGNSTGKEMISSYIGGVLHNLPAGGILIPQGIRPILEVVTNYSFFTKRPIEGMSDAGLPTAFKGDKASAFAKTLSSAGLDKLSLSPTQIDYLFQGYFAELGILTTEAASYAINTVNGKTPPARNLAETPFFKAFMANPNTDKAVADFYEVSQTAIETVNAFNQMAKRGLGAEAQEYIADPEKRMLIGASSAMRQIRDSMADIRKQMVLVRESQNLDPEKKRETLNKLQSVFNRLAQQGVSIADRLNLR